MRSQRRQSQVINNFFTFVTIVMISIVLVLYIKYGPKEKRVNSKLSCQELTQTSDKIFDEELLKKAYLLLQKGNYEINGGFIKPKFGKFFLKDEISLLQADEKFVNSINIKQKNSEIFLNIKYEIIENDKNDPRKKDEYCKLHAGSLQTSFRIQGKEAFRVYTDFLTYDKKEIEEKISCSIKAFKYNGKN